jgi:hypothetical protein
MTLPVYDTIPVPDRGALVNIPGHGQQQATTIDTNFDRINTYLTAAQARGRSMGRSMQGADISGDTPGWVNYPAPFTPVTFVVPVCEALIVSMNTRAFFPGYASCSVRAVPSGPGWKGGTLQADTDLQLGAAPGPGRWMAGGTTYVIQAAWGLNAGASITFQPQRNSGNSGIHMVMALLAVTAV